MGQFLKYHVMGIKRPNFVGYFFLLLISSVLHFNNASRKLFIDDSDNIIKTFMVTSGQVSGNKKELSGPTAPKGDVLLAVLLKGKTACLSMGRRYFFKNELS